MKSCFLLFSVLLLASISKGQDVKGRDFWFTFPPNGETNYNAPSNSYYIYLISDYCTEGTVEIPELGYTTTFTGDPGTYVEILLPTTAGGQSILHVNKETVEGKGIHIVSDYPVAAFAVTYQQASVDGEAIIPTDWLGTKYVPAIRAYSSSSPTRVTVVATEDNTTVSMKTWANNGNPVTLSTVLDQGQTYMFNTTRNNCPGDNNTGYNTECISLTASVIESDKPIAVIGGNDCSSMLVCGACDVLMTMMLPEDRWGSEYVTAQPVLRLPAQNLACLPGALTITIQSMADMLEIVGPVGTNVSITNLNGTTNHTINPPPYDNGASYGYGYIWYENPKTGGGLTGEANGEANTIIQSSNPIEIVQYGKGWQTDGQNFTDPESVVVYPVDSWTDSYLAATLQTPTTVLSEATIVVKDVGAPSPTTTILQDGANVGAGGWQDIGNGSYKFKRVTTNMLATTRFENTSGTPFAVYQTARSAAESYTIMGAFGGLLSESCPGCPLSDFSVGDICEGDSAVLSDNSIDPKFNLTEFMWIFGDGDTLVTTSATSPTHVYHSAGTYTVKYIVTNDAIPICKDTMEFEVHVIAAPSVDIGTDETICEGDSVWIGKTNPVIGNNPPYIFTWTGSNLLHPDSTRAQVFPNSTTQYPFSAEDQLGCIGRDTVEVEVLPIDEVNINPHPPICIGATAEIEFTYSGTLDVDAVVRDSDNNEYTVTGILSGNTLNVSPTHTTKYWIKNATQDGGNGCIKWGSDTIEVVVVPKPEGTLYPDLTLCEGTDSSIFVALQGLAPWQVHYSSDDGNTYTTTAPSDTTEIAITGLTQTTIYTLDSITYSAYPGCISTPNQSVTVTVHPMPDAGDPMEIDLCMNRENFNLFDTLLVGGGTPDAGGKWIDTDNSNGLTGNTINLPVIAQGDYTFHYIVEGTSPCPSDTNHLLIHLKSSPQFSPQTEECLPSETEFVVMAEITEGDPSSYAVSGGGSIIGSSFVSNPIPTGDSYQFIVTDNFGCGADTISGVKKCSCLTSAGTMNLEEQEFCEGEDIDVTAMYHSNFIDDGDDAYIFILHDNNGPSLGTILQQNTSAAVFSYDPVLLSGTHYVSPVAANRQGGSIDFTDPCLSVGPGIPITYFPLPTASFGNDTIICLGGSADIGVAFTGFQPFSLVGNNLDTLSGLASTDIISFSPQADTTLEFIEVFNNRCANTLNETVQIDVKTSPRAQISGIDTLCENTATSIDFQVELSGQGSLFDVRVQHDYPGGTDSATYNGRPPGIHTFSLPVHAIGTHTIAGIFVEDNSGGSCPGYTEGTANISIKPTPEISFALDATALCLGEPQNITFSIVPANQNYFVSIEDQTTGSVFTYQNVTNGSTYPLPTSVAGTHTISIVDFYDVEAGPHCSGIVQTPPTDFEVNPAPTISIQGPEEYCADGTPIALHVHIDGLAPYSFNIENNGIAISPLNFTTSNSDTTLFLANTTGTHAFTGIDLSDASLGDCPGFGIDTLDVDVHPIPEIALPTLSEYCSGEDISLEFGVLGTPPISIQLKTESGNSFSITDMDGDGLVDTTLASILDSTYIVVERVFDSTPVSCDSIYNDTLWLHVNPLPTADLRIGLGLEEICDGENAKIEIAIDGTDRAKAYYSLLSTGEQDDKLILASSGYRSITISSPPLGWNYFRLDSLVSETGAECRNDLHDIDSMYVHPNPELTFSILEDEICYGNPAQYTVSAQGSLPIEFEFSNQPGILQTIDPGDSITGDLIADTDGYFSIQHIQYVSTPNCAQDFTASIHVDSIVVLPLPTGDLELGLDEICEGQNVSYTIAGSGNTTWIYHMSLDGVALPPLETSHAVITQVLHDVPVGPHTLVLDSIVDAAGCKQEINDAETIEALPAPDVHFSISDTAGCPPLTIAFTNQTTDDFISCTWNFGNGNTFSGSCDTIYQPYVKPGVYDASLTLENDVGCTATLTMPKIIEIFKNPVADFSHLPVAPNLINSTVNFTNTSEHAHYFSWYVDSSFISSHEDPIYQFPYEEEGLYRIQLHVASEFGCTDSIVKLLAVEGIMLVNIPNSFTPDGDGKNDLFLPIIIGEDPELSDYQLVIYDRWGIPLFETQNIHQGWDGLKADGTEHPVGHYVYTVAVRSKYDATKKKYAGSIHLIR